MKKFIKLFLILGVITTSNLFGGLTSDPVKDNISYHSSLERDHLKDYDLNWLSYITAFQKSFKENSKKPLLVMVGATDCPYCDSAKVLMKKDNILKRYLSENFHLVYLDQDVDFVPVDLISKGTPAFWFTSEKGIPLRTVMYGLKNTKTLLMHAREVIEGM